MAHFAELESKTDPTGFTSDTHLVVKRVVVVGNDEVPSDEHVDGETWCVNFFGGGTWKQTSYNNNFRKRYAGRGMIYNASKNKFLLQQPHASWALDSSDDWQSPITFPSVTTFDHASEKYSQDDVDNDVYSDAHEKAGQRMGSFSVGDAVQVPYFISWNETKYNADNDTGWEAIKSDDNAETKTVYNWNGSAWVSA